MPLVAEHVRLDKKTALWKEPVWNQVGHDWSWELLILMSALIEEDGGPAMAYGSGYGELARRPSVDHTFTQDYNLPDEQGSIQTGDRVRMWREGIGLMNEPPLNQKGATQ